MVDIALKCANPGLAEKVVYQRNGASPELAHVMESHFQLYYFNSKDSIDDLKPKTEWAPAYADDLAIRMVLLGNLPEAAHLLRVADAQSKSGEPNQERRIIAANLQDVQGILNRSLANLNRMREVKKLPSLDYYLR